MISVWIMILVIAHPGFHEYAYSTVTIDNIVSAQECETKRQEIIRAYPIFEDRKSLCMEIKKVK